MAADVNIRGPGTALQREVKKVAREAMLGPLPTDPCLGSYLRDAPPPVWSAEVPKFEESENACLQRGSVLPTDVHHTPRGGTKRRFLSTHSSTQASLSQGAGRWEQCVTLGYKWGDLRLCFDICIKELWRPAVVITADPCGRRTGGSLWARGGLQIMCTPVHDQPLGRPRASSSLSAGS